MSYYPYINSIFINDRLKKKLSDVKMYPVTTIIAPVGYGKTTAINWWAKNQLEKNENTVILRQIILTDSLSDFWSGFSNSFKNYPILADHMEALGYPGDARSIYFFTQLFKEMLVNNKEPIYFILDDVHIIRKKEQINLLLFLSQNMPEKFHIILLSRNQIFDETEKMRLGSLLCDITISDLRLKKNEVDIYAKSCGLKPTDDVMKKLAEISEGWISMIYLNFKYYTQNKTWLLISENIYTLINEVLFNPLPENIREFLILLGITDGFTMEQAEYLWQNSDAADLLETLTKNNAFITKNENGIYRYHHMLQKCARQGFHKKPESYQRQSYSKLGYWHLRSGEYKFSYNAFYKAEDWNGLFTTIEKDRFLNFNKEDSQNVCRWLKECPEDIILKYPSAITSCMVEMFVINNIMELKLMKRLLLKSLKQNNALTLEEKSNLLGDAEVSESFIFYNNISAMSDCYRKASSLLNRTSLSINQMGAWTFSAPSVLMMYHCTVGGADRENEELKKCIPYYYQISNGHGSGAEHAFQAELFYERGQIINADISNRIAMSNAKIKSQFSIMVNSKILSMRMAVYNGSWDEIEECNVSNRKLLMDEKQYILINTLDIGLCYIYSLLGHPESAPEWIFEKGLSNATIMFPAMPMFNTFYNQLLLAKKDWIEVVARNNECKEINGVHNNVMCRIWLHIHQSAALEKLDRHADSVSELTKALDLAVPDNIIMPFVENEVYIESILKEITGKGIYVESIDRVLKLSERFRKGKQKIQFEHWNEYEKYGLSKKELIIAKLASQRKTNLEIANELHLAEGTVRNQLSHIFEKLNINGNVKNKRIMLESLLKMKE